MYGKFLLDNALVLRCVISQFKVNVLGLFFGDIKRGRGEGAHLIFKTIFHRVLNLCYFDCEITL